MCDGRPFASSPFRRMAGRVAFFRGFLFRWVSHLVLSLTRSVIMHDAASCSREDYLCERGPKRYIVMLLFCPMASAEPIHIDAADSVNEGY